ncbi:hypothetical protein Angca_007859, partial [Angiostrongylus cantonensis]
WDHGSANESTLQRCLRKFRRDEFHLGDEGGPGRPSAKGDDKLSGFVRANKCTTVPEFVKALNISTSTVSEHLGKTVKLKKPDEWMPHE